MPTTPETRREVAERIAESEPVPLAVHHCGDTYKACCLPWGWCHCICGDCRVAKHAAQEAIRNEES